MLASSLTLLQKEKFIYWTIAVCILIYFSVLVWTLVNAKLFLYDQSRYKTTSVLLFYILAVLILLSRIIGYLQVIVPAL